MNVSKYRDLSILKLNNEESLVIACDSLGGIGPKEKDSIYTPGEIVGKFTTRVSLMEVLASGAMPITVINNLSVEMEPTGKEIIKGIKDELINLGLKEDILITGSTEENIKTVQTGLGVTVIGLLKNSDMRLGKSKKGDIVLCLGNPEVGEEVLKPTPKASPSLVLKLNKLKYIHEILPVGSKGIKYEAEELARCIALKLNLDSDIKVDLNKSAGPSTCVLVTLEEEFLSNLKDYINVPIYKIGKLV